MGDGHQGSRDGAREFARVSQHFRALSELEPGPRAEKLDALRRQDPVLAREVERLLDGAAASADWLDRPALDISRSGKEGHPEQVGPYRILGRLGSGGMGAVYRAVRTDGSFEQEVAVKLLRADATSEESYGRFAAERQILARLEHPGIARLIDGGTLGDGTAYLVLELVDGLTIDRHVEENHLGTRDRVQLMIQVCAAVDYAHRHLVVHRDIKPANILVDSAGRVRLLDFGIARLLDNDDRQRLTGTGILPMTPEYASPEQFAGLEVTVASDIYALGALLYRLLTGQPPLPLAGLTLETMLDTVLHRQPEPPRALRADLPADLEAIALMALRKEPQRRYHSAADMARDLRRFLDAEPVVAHPDRLGYRAGKFLRRHTLAVTAATVFAVGLAASSAFALWQAGRAESQRDRAERESARAGQVLEFLQEMLASASPEQAQGKEPTVRELLDRTAANLDEDALEPLSRAAVLETLGSSYLALGLAERGRPLAAEAAALTEAELGPEDLRTLTARHRHAMYHLYASEYREAITILEPTLAARRRILGPHRDTASTMGNLAIAYAGLGRVDDALALDEARLAMLETLTGPDSADTLNALINLGASYHQLGRYEEAATIFRRVWEGQTRNLGERHPKTLSALNNLAVLLRITGRTEDAEQRYRQLIGLRQEVLGPEHPQTFNAISNLGEFFLMNDRPADAQPLIEEAYARRLDVLGPAHQDTLESMVSLSRLALSQGDAAGAESLAREAYVRAREAVGPDSPPAAYAASALARSLSSLGRREEARRIGEQELTRRKAQLGSDHPEVEEMVELMAKLDEPGG